MMGPVVVENCVLVTKMGRKVGKFYGMEWPWVGAFTEKWGS